MNILTNCKNIIFLIKIWGTSLFRRAGVGGFTLFNTYTYQGWASNFANTSFSLLLTTTLPNMMSYPYFQLSTVTQSCPTLCNPMDYSKPCSPVLHYLPEFAQTHVHWGDDAILSSRPLSPPSSSALSLSQHQGLFPLSRLSYHMTRQLCILEFTPRSWNYRSIQNPAHECL